MQEQEKKEGEKEGANGAAAAASAEEGEGEKEKKREMPEFSDEELQVWLVAHEEDVVAVLAERFNTSIAHLAMYVYVIACGVYACYLYVHLSRRNEDRHLPFPFTHPRIHTHTYTQQRPLLDLDRWP